MKNELSKTSTNRLNLFARAGCNMVLLPITLLLGVLLIISGIALVPLMESISITNRVTFSSIATLVLATVVSFIALVYVAGKNFGRLRNQFIHYRRVSAERKRVERLMTQAKTETATETDNLDYLAEAENTGKAKYS